jgi:hypothetical protein
MNSDEKVISDLYRISGEALMPKIQTQAPNSSNMMNKLQQVKGLAILDDNKINHLLNALDQL